MKHSIGIFLYLFSCSTYAGLLGISTNEIVGGRLQKNQNGEYEVCWVGQVDSETIPLRKNIEFFLKSQITEKAKLALKFYDDCLLAPDPFFPVGIGFYDAIDNSLAQNNEFSTLSSNSKYPGHPMTFSKGYWANKNLVDILLTSHFKNVNESLLQQSSSLTPNGKFNLLLSIALHELLHAFGFEHEQNRPDSKCLVGKDAFHKSVHTPLDDYDSVSIMNYCNTHAHAFNGSALQLSVGDIAALKQLYSK